MDEQVSILTEEELGSLEAGIRSKLENGFKSVEIAYNTKLQEYYDWTSELSDRTRDNLEKANVEVMKLRAVNQTLTEQNNGLLIQNQDSVAQNKILQESLDSQTLTLANHVQKIQSLNDSLHSATEAAQLVDKQNLLAFHSQLTMVKEVSETELAQLRAEIGCLSKELERKSDESNRYKIVVSQLDLSHSKLLEGSRIQREETLNHLTRYENEFLRLRQQLREQEEKLEATENELIESRMTLARGVGQVSKLETDLDSARDQARRAQDSESILHCLQLADIQLKYQRELSLNEENAKTMVSLKDSNELNSAESMLAKQMLATTEDELKSCRFNLLVTKENLLKVEREMERLRIDSEAKSHITKQRISQIVRMANVATIQQPSSSASGADNLLVVSTGEENDFRLLFESLSSLNKEIRQLQQQLKEMKENEAKTAVLLSDQLDITSKLEETCKKLRDEQDATTAKAVEDLIYFEVATTEAAEEHAAKVEALNLSLSSSRKDMYQLQKLLEEIKEKEAKTATLLSDQLDITSKLEDAFENLKDEKRAALDKYSEDLVGLQEAAANSAAEIGALSLALSEAKKTAAASSRASTEVKLLEEQLKRGVNRSRNLQRLLDKKINQLKSSRVEIVRLKKNLGYNKAAKTNQKLEARIQELTAQLNKRQK